MSFIIIIFYQSLSRKSQVTLNLLHNFIDPFLIKAVYINNITLTLYRINTKKHFLYVDIIVSATYVIYFPSQCVTLTFPVAFLLSRFKLTLLEIEALNIDELTLTRNINLN